MVSLPHVSIADAVRGVVVFGSLAVSAYKTFKRHPNAVNKRSRNGTDAHYQERTLTLSYRSVIDSPDSQNTSKKAGKSV